jgi:hypothetical protein
LLRFAAVYRIADVIELCIAAVFIASTAPALLETEIMPLLKSSIVRGQGMAIRRQSCLV